MHPDLEKLLELQAKDLALLAADREIKAVDEQIAALDAALAEAGVPHRSEVYARAHHGYTMSDTPVYDEQACERHFAALFDLLDRRAAGG